MNPISPIFTGLFLVLLLLPLHVFGQKTRFVELPRSQVPYIANYVVTNYLGVANGAFTENSRRGLPNEVVIDQARILSIVGDSVKFEIIVRSEVDKDEPLTQYQKISVNEERVYPFNEVVTIKDYDYTGTREVVSFEGISPERIIDFSITKPADYVFRVFERKVVVTAFVKGASDPKKVKKINLTLKKRLPAPYTPYIEEFEWRFVK